MSYFAIPYQILFHDTMAYGSHHHMTNFKFQNIARETILFGGNGDKSNGWQQQLKDILLLTREAYSLNLSPVSLGEKVAILLTYETPTRSTVKLCFRVIKDDGEPVSCGYQTMVLLDRRTHELVPAPTILSQYLDVQKEWCILENLKNPSFAEQIHKPGGTKEIFSKEVISIGKHIAKADAKKSYPKIINQFFDEYVIGDLPLSLNGNKVVFVFPGQGSYKHSILHELFASFPDTKVHFEKADEITERYLGCSFSPLIKTPSEIEHDNLLKLNPDLNQIGIYLTDVLIAKILINSGLKPDLLVGHSFGELAALAISGVYNIETGLEIVCERILALQSLEVNGKMAAVSCGLHRIQEILKGDIGSIEVAVINHANQVVVSGNVLDLEILSSKLAQHGVSLTFLKSRYPFHSSLLKDIVKPYQASLKAHSYQSADIPIFHCGDRIMYASYNNLPGILSSQFVKQFDFSSIVTQLYQKGYRNFVECGGGDIVSNLIKKNITGKKEVKILTTAIPGMGVKQGIEETLINILANDDKLNKIKKPVEETIVRESKTNNKPKIELASDIDILYKSKSISANVEMQTSVQEKSLQLPIAIVSMGCVLPEAKNPDEYWENIKTGVNGIKNLAEINLEAGQDFVAGSIDPPINIVSDKTYALLSGSIANIDYDPSLLSSVLSPGDFKKLTRGQKLLTLSIAQSLNGLRDKNQISISRMQCIIGSTADGSTEFDEALFSESIRSILKELDEPKNLYNSFLRQLDVVIEYKDGDSKQLQQHKLYKKVLQKFVSSDARIYVIDTACSSSLYSINLGIKALRNYESDLILAGGVFAPGPANNTLFAQFRGLTATKSRPLDRSADGVVFSDGAGIVILKRLTDALSDGDRILGVIRGMGLSSDGKSPSINVPQSKGQILAINKAYSESEILINSIQYIEAHATATPVGDAVEFNSLKEAFQNRDPNLPKIELGSVKALIGHTGWVSGVASVIKMCLAFREKMIPKQYHYASPNENFEMENSPFDISENGYPWPQNIDSCPRRCGINAFGFGGTNAHLILEEYSEAYHQDLCRQHQFEKPRTPHLVIVGMGSLFPGTDQLGSPEPSSKLQFNRKLLRLPDKKMLLPDVTDHMDASQFLATLAAEKILTNLSDKSAELKNEIGVVLGITSKTERGVQANVRIYLDRLDRVFKQRIKSLDLEKEELQRLLNKLIQHIKANIIPSGSYTLPGLMPNICASRISNMFDLKGPNLVVDMGENSLYQSLMVATQLITYRDCKIVIAGGINAINGRGKNGGEAAFMLGLTDLQTAKEFKLPIISKLEITDSKSTTSLNRVPISEYSYRGASGCIEIKNALDLVITKKEIVKIREKNSGGNQTKEIIISPYKNEIPDINTIQLNGIEDLSENHQKTYAFIQDTPINYFTPEMFEEQAKDPGQFLKNRKVLFITDQSKFWKELEKSGYLNLLEYKIVCSNTTGLDKSISIDLDSDSSIEDTSKDLDEFDYDTIIAIKNLEDYTEKSLLEKDVRKELILLELLFAVCKKNYSRIRNKEVSVLTLCINAFYGQTLNPFTGILAGFMKSISRELPDSNCKIINTEESNVVRAIEQVEIELGQSDIEEVCYKNGKRKVIKLTPIGQLANDEHSFLNSESIIIATGGGRGVTAVLVEELLIYFKCTVIAFGRTSLSDAPNEILNMDELSFERYEKQFYQEEMAKDNPKSITQLKAKYLEYQAINELSRVIDRLHRLPGSFSYMNVDITDRDATDNAIREVFKRYGRIDMVLHGAGVQVSKTLPKKSINDFRKIIYTKLAGLSYIFQACEKLRKGNEIHYHLLTSAFSYLGNDGQPDYGSSNEAMNRIAESMNRTSSLSNWSSLAWLGWAGVGMTKGSEFAALAANRKLRGIKREEGQIIFRELIKGKPTVPVNILMAQGEIDYYHPSIANEGSTRYDNSSNLESIIKNTHTYELEISVENTPFLLDHVVNGIPTLPGSFLIAIAGDSAKQLRPKLNISAFENTSFKKFVRVYRDLGAKVKVNSNIISEQRGQSVIHVQIFSDFTHKSGMILKEDILQTEIYVRMTEQEIPAPEVGTPIHTDGMLLVDPYVMKGTVVELGKHFNTMENIKVAKKFRSADYQLGDLFDTDSIFHHLLPTITMVDAFWRFGTINLTDKQTLPVYVPERCDIMKVYFDFNDYKLPMLLDKLTFSGSNPHKLGNQLHIGPIEVISPDGKVMIVLEGGVCRKFGEIVLDERITV